MGPANHELAQEGTKPLETFRIISCDEVLLEDLEATSVGLSQELEVRVLHHKSAVVTRQQGLISREGLANSLTLLTIGVPEMAQ